MNIMRKILSQGSTASQTSPTGEDPGGGGAQGEREEDEQNARPSPSSSGPPPPPPAPAPAPPPRRQSSSSCSSASRKEPQDLLGLSHLRKLFAEYRCPPHPLSEAEKESRLRAMLPLFCKVFASCAQGTANERLPELTPLAQATARMLVGEVRRRASNQSTEEAAAAIAEFMEVRGEGNGDEKGGWVVLSAINVMSGEGDAMVEVRRDIVWSQWSNMEKLPKFVASILDVF